VVAVCEKCHREPDVCVCPELPEEDTDDVEG